MKHKYDMFDDELSLSSKGTYKRCYESHKPLTLGEGLKIYGGSCGSPIITDADVYVGLDMSHRKSNKAYPWEQGESFLYYIQDMHAPADKESFIQLIDWLAVQLTAKKKVHVGCIGGHGRTGTVLAALANVMLGEKNAIQFVRDNYCHKAVESMSQVKFLTDTFGIVNVEPAKAHHVHSTSKMTQAKSASIMLASSRSLKRQEEIPTAVEKIKPSKAGVSIWGKSVIFDNA